MGLGNYESMVELEIPLILEEWTNSREYVYWSQMDTIEALDEEDSK